MARIVMHSPCVVEQLDFGEALLQIIQLRECEEKEKL